MSSIKDPPGWWQPIKKNQVALDEKLIICESEPRREDYLRVPLLLPSLSASNWTTLTSLRPGTFFVKMSPIQVGVISSTVVGNGVAGDDIVDAGGEVDVTKKS